VVGSSAGLWRAHLAISGQGAVRLRHLSQSLCRRVTNISAGAGG